MKLQFRMFRSEGFLDTQGDLVAAQAAEFATAIGPAKLFNVSHAMDGHIHIITVWYWNID